MFQNRISEKAQAALDAVIGKFETGDLSQVLQIARIKRQPGDGKPSNDWTISNLILAYLTTKGSTDCRGYNQWQKVNRQVQKGQSSGYIFVPLFRTIEEDGDDRKILTGFKAVAVFGLEQTEGEDLPTFDYTPAELPALLDVAKALGVTVEFCPLPPDRAGDVDLPGTVIRVGVEGEGSFKTFFHELGHAVHARIEGKPLQAGQDARQETIAEFTACTLAHLYGYDYSGNAWEYISKYNADPVAAIMQALGTVEEVIALIEKTAAEIH